MSSSGTERLSAALAARYRIERQHQPPAEQRVPPINAFLDRTLGPIVLR